MIESSMKEIMNNITNILTANNLCFFMLSLRVMATPFYRDNLQEKIILIPIERY